LRDNASRPMVGAVELTTTLTDGMEMRSGEGGITITGDGRQPRGPDQPR
jgi:hypothetical protein